MLFGLPLALFVRHLEMLINNKDHIQILLLINHKHFLDSQVKFGEKLKVIIIHRIKMRNSIKCFDRLEIRD